MASLARTIIGSGPRLVLCHGFTQTSASWGDFGHELGRDHELIMLDMPGHGDSSGVEVNFTEAAELLGEDVEAPFALLGYSMGGRLSVAAALGARRPSHLILLGATAGIIDPSERALRVEADERLAVQIERDGVAAFVERWLAMPMFAQLTVAPSDLAGRLSNSSDGLARCLRDLGTGAQPDLWGRLGEITVPTLLVVGEQDQKFRSIADQMATALPDVAIAVVAGAGHACHLEQPTVTAQVVASWLEERRR